MKVSSAGVVFVVLAVAGLGRSSSDNLVLSVRASGYGMTWTTAQDYVLFLRSDGTLVYTALDSSEPSLHVKMLSKEETNEVAGKARRVPDRTIKPKPRKFSDCSLDIEIRDYTTKAKLKGNHVDCDLADLPPSALELLCDLDGLRGDGKGVSPPPMCKQKEAPSTSHVESLKPTGGELTPPLAYAASKDDTH